MFATTCVGQLRSYEEQEPGTPPLAGPFRDGGLSGHVREIAGLTKRQSHRAIAAENSNSPTIRFAETGSTTRACAAGRCRIELSAVVYAAKKFRNPRARRHSALRSCSIVGVGSYLPTRVVSNDEIGRSIGQSADWIFRRTGIRERRVAGSDEHTSELAARAAVDALRHAQID